MKPIEQAFEEALEKAHWCVELSHQWEDLRYNQFKGYLCGRGGKKLFDEPCLKEHEKLCPRLHESK